MSFKLLHDAERGISMLIGGPDTVTSGGLEGLEPEMRKAVEAMLTHMGIEPSAARGEEINVAFDLINKALNAVADANAEAHDGAIAAGAGHTEAHAAAGADTTAADVAEGAAAEPETAAVTEPDPEPAKSSGEAAARAAGDTEATPVTTPAEGNVVCPTCDGWKTVAPGGNVQQCPTCDGKGEIPAHMEQQAREQQA